MSSDAPSFRTDAPSALPPGTRLGEIELLSLLGVGGFGIVYLAFDHALEREVAVKEYMPASLAGRTETMHVSLRSHSDAESFALGLRSFVNEAKLLARFDHPSLLKVHRFWEANGTAYMAMPVLRGRTLKELRAEMTGSPDESWLRNILMPLLGAIEKLHSEDVYHRDIAPDNIQIEPDGRPVLLDFGAARRVLSDKSQALTAILKPAYAPIEQYGEAGSVRQGPWTDIYALGATLHYMLLGRPPSPATARTVQDEASHLTPEQLPGCSSAFLQAIDWMLCPRPLDRPQSVAELRRVLEGEASAPLRRLPDGQMLPWERTDVLPPQGGRVGIDLDVGDGSTQLVPKAPPMRPRTDAERVAVEFQSSTGRPRKPVPVAPAIGLASPDIRVDGGVDADDIQGQTRHVDPLPTPSSKLPWVMGVGLAALVAAGFFLWPKIDEGLFKPQATAPAASAAALRVPAEAAAPPASAATDLPPPQGAASAPVVELAAPVIPIPALPTAEVAGGASSPAMEAVKPADSPPEKPARTASGPAVSKPTENLRQRAEVRVPRQNPVPAPAAVVPAGPGPSCGSRDGVRYLVCMERECGTAEFTNHPACQRWKQ